jgi:alkaline phosphatase D
MFYLPVRSYWEVPGPENIDIAIKYLPDGNSKFGAVEIQNLPGGGQSVLKYRLFIDGVEAWSHVLTTPGRNVKGR